MTYEHCMDPLDELPTPRERKPVCLGIYVNEWTARRALDELARGLPGYHVAQTERGWELLREWGTREF